MDYSQQFTKKTYGNNIRTGYNHNSRSLKYLHSARVNVSMALALNLNVLIIL